jgi:hypothetical protein
LGGKSFFLIITSIPGRLEHKKPAAKKTRLDQLVSAYCKICHFKATPLSAIFVQDLLLSKLPLSAKFHFPFERSENFIFLLGLHLRIFRSLARSA